MNSLQINELTYKFQDLVIQNKMPSFKNFKNEIYKNFIIFSAGQLEKIFAFIETMRKHPKSAMLVQALKPMFKMLLENMINRNNIVNVLHIKTKKRYNIELKNISIYFKRKKIIKSGNKSYIIPYKPDMATLIRRQNAFLHLMFHNKLDSFNLYEHEIDQNDDV